MAEIWIFTGFYLFIHFITSFHQHFFFFFIDNAVANKMLVKHSCKILAQARPRNLSHCRTSWGQCYVLSQSLLHRNRNYKPLFPLRSFSVAAVVHSLSFCQEAPLDQWRCNLILNFLHRMDIFCASKAAWNWYFPDFHLPWPTGHALFNAC